MKFFLFSIFCRSFGIELELNCEQRTTSSGLTCQHWSSQTPHPHEFSPDVTSKYSIPDDNICLSLHFDEPWCFTTDENVRWEACFPCESESDESSTEVPPGTTDLPQTTEASTQVPTTIMTRPAIQCEDPGVTVDDSCVQISSTKELFAMSSGTDISLSFTIPGDLFSSTASVLIEFPGTVHNVDFFGISGADAQRFDFKRFQILLSDDFDSESEIEIIGFLAGSNTDGEEIHVCASGGNFKETCSSEESEDQNPCLTECWTYDDNSGSCFVSPDLVSVSCGLASLSVEYDACVFPENYDSWSLDGFSSRILCGGNSDTVLSKNLTFSEAIDCGFEPFETEETLGLRNTVEAFHQWDSEDILNLGEVNCEYSRNLIIKDDIHKQLETNNYTIDPETIHNFATNLRLTPSKNEVAIGEMVTFALENLGEELFFDYHFTSCSGECQTSQYEFFNFENPCVESVINFSLLSPISFELQHFVFVNCDSLTVACVVQLCVDQCPQVETC